MILNLYTIKDKLAGTFAPVYSSVNDSVAVRMARQMFKGQDNGDDFSVWHVGKHDLDNGEIESFKPTCILISLEIKKVGDK